MAGGTDPRRRLARARRHSPSNSDETCDGRNALHGRTVSRLYREAVDVVQADVSRVGGVTEWLKVAALARSWNLPMAPHFVLDVHLPLVAATSNGLCVEAIFPWISQIVGQRVQPVGGIYSLGDTPGHGLSISDDVKREYRMD